MKTAIEIMDGLLIAQAGLKVAQDKTIKYSAEERRMVVHALHHQVETLKWVLDMDTAEVKR